jgi:aspartate aminotransferase
MAGLDPAAGLIWQSFGPRGEICLGCPLRPRPEVCCKVGGFSVAGVSCIHEICNNKTVMTVTAPAKVFADRIGRIEVSATMAVAAEAAKLRAQGANLVDFGAGEPHFPTPRHIKDAAIAAIDANFTRYTVVPGIPDVRKAIVERHACDFGSDYAIDEAIFTTGGKHALFNAIQILVDHGDEVILPVPYWVSFKDIIQYAGGTVVYLETGESENFRITADSIERAITPRTKAIILNSPSNPAGSVVSAQDLERIVQLAHDRGIFLLLDECYVYLNYAGNCVSGGSYTWAKEHLVILGSLSKTYSMTGWRAGYALASKAIVANLSKLQSQQTSNATSVVQKAAVAALSGSQECVAQFRAEFIDLRDYMLAKLAEIPGVTCTRPEGAFYVYPNIGAFIGKGGVKSATELATRLLHEAHVVTVPGEAFGTGEHIRISYPVTKQNIDEGVRRMKEFLGNLS